MASAADDLEPASDPLKSSILVFQMFHDDAKVLRNRPHLVVETLLQLSFSFFGRSAN